MSTNVSHVTGSAAGLVSRHLCSEPSACATAPGAAVGASALEVVRWWATGAVSGAAGSQGSPETGAGQVAGSGDLDGEDGEVYLRKDRNYFGVYLRDVFHGNYSVQWCDVCWNGFDFVWNRLRLFLSDR